MKKAIEAEKEKSSIAIQQALQEERNRSQKDLDEQKASDIHRPSWNKPFQTSHKMLLLPSGSGNAFITVILTKIYLL